MWHAPSWWSEKGLISGALLPFSWVYGGGVRLCSYKKNPVKLSIPVLCIGNITAGGAGKTPVALSLGQMFKDRGINAYYLSRGYGGALAGPLLVDYQRHTAAQVGDEPLLLAQRLPTVVAHDRLEGARFAIAQGATLLIMDDGLQNHAFHKDCSLVVIDSAYGVGNGRLLPAGPLREPVNACLNHTNGLVVIGENKRFDLLPWQGLPSFHASVAPKNPLPVSALIAFAGIAHPNKFLSTLNAMDANIVKFIPFPDHHPYTEEDLRTLAHQSETMNAALITTAKDAVRLPPSFRNRVHVLHIELQWTDLSAVQTLLSPLMERGNAD